MKERYFKGDLLWGDDFTEEQIIQWFEDEAEAYADQYGVESRGIYTAHNINILNGYNYLKKIDRFENVLGYGSSWGDEFLPIIDRIQNIYIVEASKKTRSKQIKNTTPVYLNVNEKGNIDLPNDFVDLITCFSTLHHIPNVTYVLNELFRVLKPGGFFLLREPMHSMGDWTKKRPGLTKHERGIPQAYLENIIRNAGITIVQKHYFGFMGSFLDRLFNGASFLHSRAFLRIDRYLSSVFSFNVHYHAKNKMQRVSPIGIAYVLRK